VKVEFRPHHFLCALCFKGRGYSPAFIANFQTIMNQLNAPGGDDTPIHIVSHTDSICAPCPNRSEKTCLTEDKIAVLDTAHAAALDIQTGQTVTWGDAKELIAKKMTMEKFHQTCASCSWKEYGICEGVLKELHDKESSHVREKHQHRTK